MDIFQVVLICVGFKANINPFFKELQWVIQMKYVCLSSSKKVGYQKSLSPKIELKDSLKKKS